MFITYTDTNTTLRIYKCDHLPLFSVSSNDTAFHLVTCASNVGIIIDTFLSFTSCVKLSASRSALSYPSIFFPIKNKEQKSGALYYSGYLTVDSWLDCHNKRHYHEIQNVEENQKPLCGFFLFNISRQFFLQWLTDIFL